MKHGARAALGTAALLLAAASCGQEDTPVWIDLARVEIGGAALRAEIGPGLRVEREQNDLWLVGEITRGAWLAGPQAGRFSAPLPVYHVGSPSAGGAVYRLRAGARDFGFESDPQRFGSEPGRFTTELTKLKLALESGEELPERSELWACLAFESTASGTRRIGGRRLSGSGVWVPAGHPRTLELEIPPGSRLRFGTAVEPLIAAREARAAPHTFRVRLDGAVIFEERVQVDAMLGEALAWHAVLLPSGGVRRARLEFEVEGPLALTSFLAPRIGPGDFGRYGARPFETASATGAKRDLVVFLADTFRADNLAAYGNSLGLTPAIDRFAAESRTFARAWSVSTHTLPAHSAMFSGVYPRQNGLAGFTNALPGAVVTLAELLAAHGYRCGLVSDGVIVSSSHGLDQGFESFDERKEVDTLARVRAFLGADDGRPIFLFVQSYRVHAPYAVEAATRARWQEVLRLDASFDEVFATPLIQAVVESAPAREAPPEDEPDQELVRRLFDLYRAKVSELDGLFARFRVELEARGLFEHATLLFTSDHGEAFFEHGRPFHTGRVYEEELRVPMLLHGPGIAPGRVQQPVSLIDFAPTLAELAGLARPAHWRGGSLLAPAEQRVLYAFQARDKDRPTMAVIDGTRKVIGYEDLEALRAGSLHAAFDLGADPGEQTSLHGREAWPAELLRAHRAALEEMLTPLVTPEWIDSTPDKRRELEAVGYGGDGR
ncbi:MAG: sulfatase [Planctomycetes bacterium]|nr:sulfatase [Planctomycetota bacterium]